MHAEWGHVGAEAADRINRARAGGGRIIAVGTTSLRLLESAADATGKVGEFDGETRLFILPGYRFRSIDLLLTNFHLPRSTLVMLVAALAGLDRIKTAYAHAAASGYRFFSYGDACLIERPGERHRVRVLARDGAARMGRVVTAHGAIETPAFMPIGTAATVKAMTPRGRGERGAYRPRQHLPPDAAARGRAHRGIGRLHRFMNWPHAILTDSGGFQVMSLAALRKIGEEGVAFRSHLDGSAHLLTPERSIAIQHLLGADITMALDECTQFPAERAAVEASMELSMRWPNARAPPLERVKAMGFSASSKAACMPTCGSVRRHGSSRSGLTAMHRWAGDRRRPGHHLRDGRGERAGAARRPAALSDGDRQTRRSCRRRQARGRHVRLRAATRSGVPARPLPGRGHSICAMPGTPTTRRPSTRYAAVRLAPASAARIYII